MYYARRSSVVCILHALPPAVYRNNRPKTCLLVSRHLITQTTPHFSVTTSAAPLVITTAAAGLVAVLDVAVSWLGDASG